MDYKVSLDNFSGPLDLLLHLVKEEEVEIHEIPITTICDRYLEYLKALEVLDVDVAADFLVMATTLMLIKSRSLLPSDAEEVDLEEELDPQDELIQQLLEYKRFKMAARDLSDRALVRGRIVPFHPPERDVDREIPLEEIDLWDLVRAFSALLRETGLDRGAPRHIHDEKPLREYIDEVFSTLRLRRRLMFEELFEGSRKIETVIGRFLALLELARRGRLRARQSSSFDRIELELLDDRELSDDEILAAEADNRPVISQDGPSADDVEREILADAPADVDETARREVHPTKAAPPEPAPESMANDGGEGG
jgi:segregation and condensation protein A